MVLVGLFAKSPATLTAELLDDILNVLVQVKLVHELKQLVKFYKLVHFENKSETSNGSDNIVCPNPDEQLVVLEGI